MDRPTIPPSIIRRSAAAVIAAIQTWFIKQRINIESLPDELLFDILVRLPADFLHHKAMLVCRRWCRIIRSDAFINTHLQQYSSYGLVISLPREIYVTAPQGRIETSELSDICRHKITASCNGLVVEYVQGACCASLYSKSLHVINPATKQSFLLPSFSTRNRPLCFAGTCIAYSASSMEYKVTLQYVTLYDPPCLSIVIVGVDKSWRHVDVTPLPEHDRWLLFSSVNSEGFLHWGKKRYCLTMNVETEMFTMNEVPIPPDQSDHYSYHYLSTGRFITLLANRHKELSWEVWEMRPAESGEWKKGVLPNIDLEPQKCKLSAIGSDKSGLACFL